MGFTPPRGLYQLARLYNVQVAYYDVFANRRQASPESLLHILQALGAPLAGMDHVHSALRERRQFMWWRCLDPVITLWGERPVKFEFRMPAAWANRSLAVRLKLDTGEIRRWNGRFSAKTTVGKATIEGADYLVKKISLPGKLPWGYHRLSIQAAGKRFQALVISAPEQAYTTNEDHDARTWGVFLPLYALHSQDSWGGGDFTELGKLVSWVKSLGGGVIGTLPILAAFLDEPFEISPYSPASRLFWNEFYLDVTKVPELERSSAAQALMASPEFQSQIDTLRSSPTVDYRAQLKLKRRVLEELVKVIYREQSERWMQFHRFVRTHGSAEDYACFRAVGERQGFPWRAWPEELRSGRISPADYEETARRYHLYVQWLADEQLGALARETNASGTGLYLDLPLGVHPDGYDVWREKDLFVQEASGGAPPDAVFISGQDWGFSPLHPERIREQGYRYMIAVLRHHLKYASFIRIDHVMGLHRLFWIPKGLGADQGVYVRNRDEELYAILSLESHRHRALITGENLGTVPRYVNSAMTRHGIQKMYVVQYEVKSDPSKALPSVPRDSVAGVNTHDMRPFAAYWEGLDIKDMINLGLLDEAKAEAMWKGRRKLQKALLRFLSSKGWLQKDSLDVAAVLRACLAYLSASPARVVLLNLEDLWLEKEPQNLPSTVHENPNWQRKSRFPFEEFSQSSDVLELLRDVAQLRTGGRRKR